jgi:hypothetical protein
MARRIVSRCPVCDGEMSISRLSCSHCETTIESTLPIPPFFGLPEDLQEFVVLFLRCRGNIREMEKALGISYPTVCKRLDLVNEILGSDRVPMDRNQILEQLEQGEISAKEAVRLLKGGR